MRVVEVLDMVGVEIEIEIDGRRDPDGVEGDGQGSLRVIWAVGVPEASIAAGAPLEGIYGADLSWLERGGGWDVSVMLVGLQSSCLIDDKLVPGWE